MTPHPFPDPLSVRPVTTPWIAAPRSIRRNRYNASFGFAGIRLAFIEAYDRCPDCAAADAARLAGTNQSFDAARDRGLLRRDVNEILETMAIEMLRAARSACDTANDPTAGMIHLEGL